jgi:hypothetical protein
MRFKAAIVALLATATFVAACGDGGGGQYSEEIRQSYLDGCGTEQNRAFCLCTLDEIEKRFSEEEFIRFAIEATEEPPEEFIEIAFACIGEADLGS